jgi:hypothetical protein
MRAARPFLLIPSEELRLQNSSHFRSFSAFLHARSKRILFLFNHFRTLSCPDPRGVRKHPGVTRSVFSNSHSSALFVLTPLDSALTDEHRVLPRFGRNRPSATLLESTLTKESCCNPFIRNTYKKLGGRGCPSQQILHHAIAAWTACAQLSSRVGSACKNGVTCQRNTLARTDSH